MDNTDQPTVWLDLPEHPYRTLADIKKADTDRGAYFWASATNGMFNTSWPQQIHPCRDGAFFVTGEHDSDEKGMFGTRHLAGRMYTVRYADRRGFIATVGTHRHYAQRKHADRDARMLASFEGAQRNAYLTGMLTAHEPDVDPAHPENYSGILDFTRPHTPTVH